MNLTNKITDVIDKSIIYRNNWIMYGSCKSNKEPYLLTKIFKYEDGNVTEIEIDREKYNDKYLVKLLSISGRIDELAEPKLDKIDELEELTENIKILKQKINAPKLKSKESGVKKMEDVELDYVFKLIDLLDISRAVEYTKWTELIWCCHNIHNTDERLLRKVIEFSKKPNQYKDTAEDACIKVWNKSKYEGGLSLGSLKHWAKLDSPKGYNKLNESNVSEKITKMLYKKTISLNTCDVSEILKIMYRNEYICVSVVKENVVSIQRS